MTKAIIFDADGMIVHGERWSDRLERQFNISKEKTAPFFAGPFQKCILGKANLEEELPKYLKEWGYSDSLQSFLDYWFEPKYNWIDARFKGVIAELRAKRIKCYLATNNEKLRTDNLIYDRELAKWFDRTFSSAYIGAKKPEAAFFDALLYETKGLTAPEIEFWDDDLENVSGAKQYGFETAHYTDFESFRHEMSLVDPIPVT